MCSCEKTETTPRQLSSLLQKEKLKIGQNHNYEATMKWNLTTQLPYNSDPENRISASGCGNPLPVAKNPLPVAETRFRLRKSASDCGNPLPNAEIQFSASVRKEKFFWHIKYLNIHGSNLHIVEVRGSSVG